MYVVVTVSAALILVLCTVLQFSSSLAHHLQRPIVSSIPFRLLDDSVLVLVS